MFKYIAGALDAFFIFCRPHHVEMAKSRRNNRSRRSIRGGGYQSSQQFFNPSVFPPTASLLTGSTSSAPTAMEIRPVLYSTFQTGGTRRNNRKMRGGFSPSIMGAFTTNAQSAIVPAALYMVYHTFVPKRGSSRRK